MNALQKWRDIKCFEVMVTFINALQKWEENESTQRCFVTNVNGVTFKRNGAHNIKCLFL